MTLLMRDLSLAEDLKETISIINQDGDVLPTAEAVILPKTDTDTILESAPVLAGKHWTVYMMDPNPIITEGDVVVRGDGLKLNITRVNHVHGTTVGNIQWLECEELQ